MRLKACAAPDTHSDAVWLRCGHYTLGQSPWNTSTAWKIVTFLRKHCDGVTERRSGNVVRVG